MLHDGDVNGVAGGQSAASENNLFRALGHRPVNREYLIDNSEQGVEGRLNGVAAIDGHISMEDLLKNLGIGNQPPAFPDQLFQPLLRVGFVGVSGTDKIHGYVGVDQNHECVLAP